MRSEPPEPRASELGDELDEKLRVAADRLNEAWNVLEEAQEIFADLYPPMDAVRTRGELHSAKVHAYEAWETVKGLQ